MIIAVRSEEWYDLRKTGVTSTDIPIILGLSPYKSEGALAREKMGTPDAEEIDAKRARRFRLGRTLESVIRDEEEIEHGVKLRRVNRILTHPDIPWAMTSLDFERVGEKVIVEAKAAAAKRWESGLPQDVEAQVRWQMGVAGYDRAHVACLRHGTDLECFDLEHEPATFDGLLVIAKDFRARLEAGGPFAENSASIKARYPFDDGSEMAADPDLTEAVQRLLSVRELTKQAEAEAEALETAIKTRMADHSTLRGEGWHVTWKRTKDSEQTDWKSVAAGLLRQLPEPERTALVGIHSTVRTGFRPFRVVKEKE